MSRILKALFKTILVFLGIVLFIILSNMFPYLLLALMMVGMIIFLFISFYENEEE